MHVLLLGQHVAGLLEPVDVRVRDAAAQIAQEPLEEHGILGAPHEEGGLLEARDVLAQLCELGVRGVGVRERDVRNESTDPTAPGCDPVGGPVSGLGGGGESVARQRQRGLEEEVRVDGRQRQHRPGQDGLEGGRQIVAGVDVHAGVERDRSGDAVLVARRPRERDDPAPVVADRHDRVLGGGVALGQQRRHDRVEVRDAVGDPADARVGRTGSAGVRQALGEAHVQVVDGDDAPAAVQARGGQVAPQVGPRGVAVGGDDRADDRRARRGQGRTGVEDVEGARPVERVDGEQARPGGVEAVERRAHCLVRQLRGGGGDACAGIGDGQGGQGARTTGQARAHGAITTRSQ